MDKKAILAILGTVAAVMAFSRNQAQAAEVPLAKQVTTVTPPVSVDEVREESITIEPEPQTTIAPPVIRELTVTADFQIPLYSLANRDIILNYFKEMTSMGVSLSDVRKIDLSNIPPAVWGKIGYDLSFAVIAAFAGPAGWIISAAHTLFSLLTGESATEKQRKMEEKAAKAMAAFKQFYIQHKIVSTPTYLLGTLAKNRVGSNLVPLIKVYNATFEDETYVTADLLPVFIDGGYKTDGTAIGYVSKLPFPKSVLIKLMFSFELMDFIVVPDSSDIERVLTYANYVAIADLGYISRIIQPGQQGIIAVDYDDLEVTHRLDTKAAQFLVSYANQTVSADRYLRENVALPAVVTAEVIQRAGLPGKSLTPVDYAYPARYPIQAGIVPIPNTKAGDNASKYSGVITTDRLTNYRTASNNKLYAPLNELDLPSTYRGIPVPTQGTHSGFVGNRVLIQQLNGALVEVWINENITNIEKIALLDSLNNVARANRPEYALRTILGPFFYNDNGYPVYKINTVAEVNNTLLRYSSMAGLW